MASLIKERVFINVGHKLNGAENLVHLLNNLINNNLENVAKEALSAKRVRIWH